MRHDGAPSCAFISASGCAEDKHVRKASRVVSSAPFTISKCCWSNINTPWGQVFALEEESFPQSQNTSALPSPSLAAEQHRHHWRLKAPSWGPYRVSPLEMRALPTGAGWVWVYTTAVSGFLAQQGADSDLGPDCIIIWHRMRKGDLQCLAAQKHLQGSDFCEFQLNSDTHRFWFRP